MTHAEEIIQALRTRRLPMSTELELQESVSSVLVDIGIMHTREAVLSKSDRPDFLTESGVALELKIDGSRNQVLRQLLRYSEHPNVSCLILITTRAKHLNMPNTVGGKPLFVHHAVSL